MTQKPPKGGWVPPGPDFANGETWAEYNRRVWANPQVVTFGKQRKSRRAKAASAQVAPPRPEPAAQRKAPRAKRGQQLKLFGD